MTLPVIYTDRADRYSTVPAAYDGFQVIQPVSGHGFRDFNLSFDIGANTTIYVAHDNRHGGTPSKPSWLDGTWTDTGDVIIGQDGVTRTVWSKAFNAGTVTLAGNDESVDWTMFLVLVPAAVAITNTVPEYYTWSTLSEADGGGGPSVQEFHWTPLAGDVGLVPTDWTKRWVDAPWQIGEAGGEYYLALDDVATSRSAISWNTLDNIDNDVQQIFEWEASNLSSQFRGLFRGSGLAADETGYVVGAVPVDPTEKINRYLNGVTTNLGQTAKTYSIGTRYHTRCEVVGTTLRSKTWVKGTAEPGWIVSATNSEITGTGWFGFFAFHMQGIKIYKLSVATSGGTAAFPAEPAGPVPARNSIFLAVG